MIETGDDGVRRAVSVDSSGRVHYWPLPPSIMVALTMLATATLAAFAINLVSYAYVRIGIAEGWAFFILFASIVGSWINVPVAKLRGTVVFEPVLVRVFGMTYVVPGSVQPDNKVIALNVGGGLIPIGLSTYLMVVNHLTWQAAVGIVAVAAITHHFARVVPGVGIVVPTLIPPIAAAVAAGVIGASPIAAVAYVSGTLGTLIGADLVNLRHVHEMEAPVLSIGGAGTFDGIFVTGILSVLLAAI
jgi:uncharacterized membrane protein